MILCGCGTFLALIEVIMMGVGFTTACCSEDACCIPQRGASAADCNSEDLFCPDDCGDKLPGCASQNILWTLGLVMLIVGSIIDCIFCCCVGGCCGGKDGASGGNTSSA